MATARKVQTYDVYVGNLPPEANDKNVGKIFSKFGEIKGIFVRESTATPGLGASPMKYAYVKFLCEADADTACSQINGIEVEGHKVVVKRTEPKKKNDKLDGDKKRGLKKPKMISQQTTPDIVPEGAQIINSVNPLSSRYSQKEKEAVMVSYVESAITIWIQVVNDENTNKLMNITEQLTSLCPAAPKVNGQPQQNKIYAAQYSEDCNWYRCCVKQFLGTDTIKVQYIDYGNTEEISIKSLVEIPPALSASKPLAHKIVFHNTRPKDLSDQSGAEFLRKLTDNKILELIRTNPLTDGSGHYGIITVEGQVLNTLVINEGFALTRPAMTGGRGAGDNKDLGSGYTCNSPGGSMSNIGMFGGGYAADKGNQGFPGQNMGRQVTGNNSKPIQIPVNRLQFPSDRASGLEEAIDLALSTDKVLNSSVTTLQPVVSTLSTYRASQKEICNCSDSSELDSLVETRNSARKELYYRLEECINELVTIPLDSRCIKLKEADEKLKKNYKGFIHYNVHGCPQLEDLVPGFRDWKGKKECEFSQVRENTNMFQAGVKDSLCILNQLLSLDSNIRDGNTNVDLEILLRNYANALQQEIAVTDMSGESNDEEFMKVKLEVEDIKFQLHKALQKLDSLVVGLSKVSDEHFPELLIQHPDLGIQISLLYNGIVKFGLDIDYFSLTPSLRVGMSSSVFAGEPVYLQEYHVGDTDHLTKEEFLKQVVTYAGISKMTDHILTVQAVFFTKNERQAYLMMEKSEDLELLDDYVTAEKMDAKKRQKIIYCVTSAISKMHDERFIHGEVCPQNIAVQPDGTSVLLQPNFSKSLMERTKKKLVTKSGLCFQAPEVTCSPDKISSGVDLYNLGLLILWVHHPDVSVQFKQDGTPRLNELPIDPEIGAILYNLLCYKPETRLNASHILSSGYLTRVIPDPPLPVIKEESSEDNYSEMSAANMPLPDEADTDDDSLLVTGTPCPPDVSGDIADIEGHIEELTIENSENSTQETDENVMETLENLEESSDILRPDILDHGNCDNNDNVELPDSKNLTSCESVEEQQQDNDVTEEVTDNMAAASETVQESEENPDNTQCSNIDLLKSLASQQSYLRQGGDSQLNRLLKASNDITESLGTPEK
ncbi:hypothetical protein KUTeg_004092 [Tegillarca granosa]|uniref:Serine/threonine-protein kinase 31 n=1 Tax=Tegillarca granosa TaxID=220873 RepID=A0ABQ9FS58_TEGGR|nr:hypothetical protein KUTeg_004092 [Tegillarca granosa]